MSLLICLPVVGCLTGKYTLKDVVFEGRHMFRLQEREKRRRRVLIEQMKAHEAQEVRKTNSTNVGNVRFSTICYFSP